jgi:hypothetical protein
VITVLLHHAEYRHRRPNPITLSPALSLVSTPVGRRQLPLSKTLSIATIVLLAISACRDATGPSIRECRDGIDNDGNGLIDYPIDPGCSAPDDDRELTPECRDGIDNDGDGLVDFPVDPGCADSNDNGELTPECNDGIDNDGDGLVDYPADPECSRGGDNSEEDNLNSDPQASFLRWPLARCLMPGQGGWGMKARRVL